MARVGILSFRLGGVDGVSIEAAKWGWALAELGHDVRTIAGSGLADIIMPGLAIDATVAPTATELHDALAGLDLVIVENLLSLPLNLPARDAVAHVLAGRPAVLHHHDLASQRSHLAHLGPPPTDAQWRHVCINAYSARELANVGLEAEVIRNSFDVAPPPGRRDETRRTLDCSNQRLVLLATRVIPRKNVEGAITLCDQLGATLWILGDVEDGYDDAFAALLAAVNVPIVRGLPNGFDIHDAYAAADLVVMPSTWEGFGNPTLESVTHRRPLAAYPYPVLEEITDFGFTFFALDDVVGIEAFLDQPDVTMLERNVTVAREHFSLANLPTRLGRLLEGMGISSTN
jgi:mannosylglucosylglycerate synthase